MSEPLPAFARLPLSFPLEPLLGALADLPEDAWTPHFNSAYHDGDWSGITLLGPSQTRNAVLPAQGPGSAAAAAVASRWHSARWAEPLQAIASPISSARLLRLGPGARIREHRDPDLGEQQGDVRLHLPLRSHPQVEFILDGQAVPMQAGELWFLDLARPHRVENRSEHSRVHLVLDVRRNAWLLEQIAAGLPSTPSSRTARSTLAFERFCERVHADAGLFEQLAALDDPRQFSAAAVRLGSALGLAFSEDEVRSAMRAGRRDWNRLWSA